MPSQELPVPDEPDLGEHDRPSRRERVLRATVSVAVVAGIFLGVLPRVADMGEVWAHVRDLTELQIATLIAATGWNLVTYWLMTIAAVPGLRLAQGAVLNLSSTAIANTVPAGGGVAVGVSVAMLRSWGHTVAEVSRYILVTGIWNNFVKLGLPVVALALLAFEGESNEPLTTAGIVGVATLAVSIGLLALALRSEELARRVGRLWGRVADAVLRLVRRRSRGDWERRAARFRAGSVDLLAARWHWLTVTTVVSHLSLYLVLLVAVRHAGVDAQQLTWVEVLAAFAVARLVTAIPLTPGGLGMIELGYVGVMTALGGDRAAVVAAVLVFRALTYLLPVPLGAATYVVWRRRTDWKEDPDDREQPATSGAAS